MTKTKLQVGQRVFLVIHPRYSVRTSTRWVDIVKVGRTRAHFGDQGSFVHMENMRAFDRNGYDWATAYLSEDEYKRGVQLRDDWEKFKDAIYNVWVHVPDGMTSEKIAEARKVLGI